MKLLVLSDVHGTHTGLLTTLELHERYKPDLTVICGDITNFGPADWAERYLKRIPGQVVAVPGNCDPGDMSNPIALNGAIGRSGALDLHREQVDVSGITFIGAGGADYTPFDTMFEFGDDTFSKWLKPLMRENAVLVTHAPAFGILDTNHDGSHRGSKSLRTIVDRWQPILMLSGHMHEARGAMRHNNTVFVNPGPAKDGFGALVQMSTPLTESRKMKDRGEKGDVWEAVRSSVKAGLVQS